MNQPLASPHAALRRQILATFCLCCGARLADAKSATLGVGPTCRKRLGIADSLKAGSAANELVAQAAIAAEDRQLTTVLERLRELVALDSRYQVLVDRTHERLFKTRVVKEPDGGYLVHSTYNSETNQVFREHGLRWDKVAHGYRATSTEQLDGALDALARAMPGGEVLGPDGEVIPLIERGYRV